MEASALRARDPVTGALPRADLDEHLSDLARSGSSYALCLFDVDYFKSVNDAYGHARGDAILAGIVARVASCVRDFDLLFRYGGDEFVIVLDGADDEDAVATAERAADAVRSAPFLGDPPLRVTVSMGIATSAEAARPEEVLEIADRRNYDAKRAGRDRVVGRDGVVALATAWPQTRLVERDEALAAVHRFVEAVARGRRAVLRIGGAPGTGRTRMLEEVAAATRMRGMVARHVRAGQPVVDPTGPGQPDASEADPAPPGTAAQAALPERPVGVLLVDADADGAMAAALAAVEKGHAVGVAVVADALPELPDAVDRLDLTLRPLSSTGLTVWLRMLVRSEVRTSLVERVADVTAGRPAAVLRALTDLGAHRATGTTRTATPEPGPLQLPEPVTALVGRERETDEIVALLGAHRLLTLLGAGGIGKTRLALAGARAYGALLADGAAFVALDEARTPDDVCRLVLAALDLPEEAGGAPLPTLVRHVRERELLLVLDNFEQALDAAPVVSELLRAAPGLRALVTSRERLRVYGERVYRVPPLEVADDDVQARRSPAVALFHLRAADTGAEDLVPTEEGERAVAELCRRLDGLPLAIELAAARSDAYSPVELLAQLDRRLDLLTDGPRDLPARQRTLRGAIDWSVHLLSPTEQLVLARLGVFAGGWTTDAAVAVCGDDRVSADAVRAALARLQEASLVHRRDGDRAALYESIRAYGLECLAAAGESDATRARHATWAADLVVSARARLWSAEYAAQLAVVERELANVRAALSWSLEHDVVTAAQLAAGLWLFWNGNGHVGEGRDWLERTIAAADERVPPALRAAMRDGAGVVATIQGDVSAAVAHLEAGLELCAAIPDADPLQIASLHSNLAHVLDQRGSYSEARQHFERGLELRRAVDDTRGVAASIGNLGDMLRRMGELDAAEVALRESLEMNRGIGNVVNAAIALANLAELQVLAGSPEARESAAAALAQAREFDDPDLEAQCLQVLGMDAADSGDLSRAADLLTQSLVLRADLGELDAVALTTEELARVATLPVDHELPHEAALRAAVLYGAAEAVRARCNVPLPPVLVERHSECAERARRVLDDLAYAAQRARGAALPLDRLVQYAAASPASG